MLKSETDLVRPLKTIFWLTALLITKPIFCQLASDRASVTISAGMVNYQGDLKPNSFTFEHANFTASLGMRVTLSRWFTWRASVGIGKLEAADRYNREYLKPRNLSFYTSLQEIYTGLEFTLLDITVKKFTPYAFGGVAVFRFKPWTYDEAGNKVFLQPLSTEGQGLADYPAQKPYKLIQPALGFGGGFRYALTNCSSIAIEFSQRKSFTDYIDDVSTHFVDRQKLLDAKGQQAVDLAYRGDELPGGAGYPTEGTQRGTQSEMDWYYFFGLSFELKFSCLPKSSGRGPAGMGCPRIY